MRPMRNIIRLRPTSGSELKVGVAVAGPETYDPAVERAEFQKLRQRKPRPSGILISAADPAILAPDIDAAMRAGIPVISIDSDASSSRQNRNLGDGYRSANP
jgi:ribose transport system substrate-binding protein